jgi:hypothetical protein
MARIVIANSDGSRVDLIDRQGVPAERIRAVIMETIPRPFRPADRYLRELQSLLLPDCDDWADLMNRLIAWRQNAEGLRELTKSAFEPMRLRTWDQMAMEIVAAAG